MPTVISDDDIYRARLVYLGPSGYTLPVQLTYTQYGLGFAYMFLLITVGWLIFGTVEVIGCSIAAAIGLTYYTWRFVDYDQPVLAVLKVAFTDWRPLRGEREQPVAKLTGSHIIVRHTITGPDRPQYQLTDGRTR